MIKKRILISGKVQGVGFRRYTQKRALENGVNGWVRNLYTGEVEVLACAQTKDQLESFLKYIRGGPERSEVIKFEMKDVAHDNFTVHTFSVEPDGEKSDS